MRAFEKRWQPVTASTGYSIGGRRWSSSDWRSGNRAGAEVAELYVGQQNPTIVRPIKELKGFQKVNLQPGQSKKVTLSLDQRSFAYFNTTTEKWELFPVFTMLSSEIHPMIRR